MDKLESHATKIVAAYVSNNAVAHGDLPALIACVRSSLIGLANVQPTATAKPAKATADEIRRSITPEALISFLDGGSYKALRRHLRSHGLDPSSYRARFGLPRNYPMVAAAYSTRRSEISRSLAFRNRPRP